MKDVFELIKSNSCNNAVLKDKLMTYGQFVGSWKIKSKWFLPHHEIRETTGKWHFSWILEGNGIQDVLFADSYSKEKYGTTIRCYDVKNDIWHVSWMQPGNDEFANLIGKKIGNEIVQEIIGLTDKIEIWKFKDITKESFLWTDEVSFDNGVTWEIHQEMTGERLA